MRGSQPHQEFTKPDWSCVIPRLPFPSRETDRHRGRDHGVDGRLGHGRAALGAYRIYLELAPRETHEVRKVRRILFDAERRRGLRAR